MELWSPLTLPGLGLASLGARRWRQRKASWRDSSAQLRGGRRETALAVYD